MVFATEEEPGQGVLLIQACLDGEYLGTSQTPWGDTRIGFTAETEVNRKDWGLEWNMALETGGVLVGEKIKLTIDVEAIRQQ